MPEELKQYEKDNVVVLAAKERICNDIAYQLKEELQIDRFLYYSALKKYLNTYWGRQLRISLKTKVTIETYTD